APAKEFGKEDAPEIRLPVGQDLPALLGLLPELLQPAPGKSTQDHEAEHDADRDDRGRPGMRRDPAELDVEGAAHRDEEIDVDSGPDHGEEDLLDEIAGEDPGERRPHDD